MFANSAQLLATLASHRLNMMDLGLLQDYRRPETNLSTNTASCPKRRRSRKPKDSSPGWRGLLGVAAARRGSKRCSPVTNFPSFRAERSR